MNERFDRNYDDQGYALPRNPEERRRWNERHSRSYRDSARDETRERAFAGARPYPNEREESARYDEPRESYERAGRYSRVGHYGPGAYREPSRYENQRDYESGWQRGYGQPREEQGGSSPRYGRGWLSGNREQDWEGEHDQRSFAVDWGTTRPPWQSQSERRSFTSPNAASRGAWVDEGPRFNQGAFAGRGPKGYTRSEERIREDVCDRLSDDDEVDASDITVTVKDGEVSLEGTVPDRRTKHRAEDIAESVGGVKDVHNALRTQKTFLQEVGDRITGRDEQDQHGHSGSGTRNTGTH